MGVKIELTDNSAEVKAAFEQAYLRGLEMCGQAAENYAAQLCPVDTGNLRNSITHMVTGGDKTAYVGTNSEYAIYVEMGTGQYYPGGRSTSWVYQDAKGKWHRTSGQKAQPYIKPSVADHVDQYVQIIEQALKG